MCIFRKTKRKTNRETQVDVSNVISENQGNSYRGRNNKRHVGVAQTGDYPLSSDKLQIVRASKFIRNFHGVSK